MSVAHVFVGTLLPSGPSSAGSSVSHSHESSALAPVGSGNSNVGSQGLNWFEQRVKDLREQEVRESGMLKETEQALIEHDRVRVRQKEHTAMRLKESTLSAAVAAAAAKQEELKQQEQMVC